MSETPQPGAAPTAKPRLNLIGAGRVGQTLAHLWQRHGVLEIQDVLTTSQASAEAACAFIGAGRPASRLDTMRPADVWMLAVQDARIAGVATDLAAQAPRLQDEADAPQHPMAFHCSGAQSSESLAPLAAQGWLTASTHCILSFASAASAVQQFPGSACALEGRAVALATLRPAFGAIGGQCFEVQAEHKLLYHAAAVFATNFLPVLEHLAEAAWQHSGVPEALIPGLRGSLMGKVVSNIIEVGPHAALTGPAAREDTAAMERQSRAVRAWDAAAADAYDALGALALRMAKARRDMAATAVKSH